MAVDYRDPTVFKTNRVFVGSYKALIILSVFGLVTGYMFLGSAYQNGSLSPVDIVGLLAFSALPIYYWLFKSTSSKPDRFVSATETPPPDLSPPGSGMIRATIQRREAKFRAPGVFGHSLTKNEMLCWLILSETATTIIKKNKLHATTIFTLPKSDDYLDQMREIDPSLAREKEWKYTLEDFLRHPPLYINSNDTVSLNYVEQQLREGLKNFNDILATSGATPTSRSESFEL